MILHSRRAAPRFLVLRPTDTFHHIFHDKLLNRVSLHRLFRCAPTSWVPTLSLSVTPMFLVLRPCFTVSSSMPSCSTVCLSIAKGNRFPVSNIRYPYCPPILRLSQRYHHNERYNNKDFEKVPSSPFEDRHASRDNHKGFTSPYKHTRLRFTALWRPVYLRRVFNY